MNALQSCFNKDKLKRKDRKKLFTSYINELEELKNKLYPIEINEITKQAVKEEFKIIELKTSILRLDQSETRLLQQIYIAIFGGVIGSILTFIVDHLIK